MVAAHNKILINITLVRIAIKANRLRVRRQQQNQACSKRTKAKNRIRDREYGLKVMSEYSNDEFERMFRLSRVGFEKLLREISTDLVHNEQQAINSSGSPIITVTRLAATLRFLAGGSYLDICGMFGLDQRNFFNKNYILWKTIHAIDRKLDLGLSLDAEYLADTAKGFSKLSKGYILIIFC